MRGNLSDTNVRSKFFALAQAIEIVRPLLHHDPSLQQVTCPIIGSPQRIAHLMGELVLDYIDPASQNLVEYGARHRAETVPRHLLLCHAHPPQSGIYSVVTHRTFGGPLAREHVRAMTRQ